MKPALFGFLFFLIAAGVFAQSAAPGNSIVGRWRWLEGVIDINGDGTISGDRTGRWEELPVGSQGRTYQFHFGSFSDTVTLSGNGMLLSGTNQDGGPVTGSRMQSGGAASNVAPSPDQQGGSMSSMFGSRAPISADPGEQPGAAQDQAGGAPAPAPAIRQPEQGGQGTGALSQTAATPASAHDWMWQDQTGEPGGSDLTVTSATYGTRSKSADVTKRVVEMLHKGKHELWASPWCLNVDPDPGWNKQLTINYEYMGVRHTFSVGEGGYVGLHYLKKAP